MDHETAVQLKATERYFLGDLTGADREGFEDHFFMCPECAEDVRAMTIFAANAKAALRDGTAPPVVPAGAFLSSRALWLSAALNIALLAGLGYTALKFAPQVKQELADARAPQFVQDVPVLGVSRGDPAVREIAPTTRRIVFSFYLPAQFQSIAYQLKDESGSSGPRVTLPAPPKEDSSESHFSLSTAGLKPGAYEIAFWGINGAGETPIGQSKFKITR
jgi:Putative zinc-finger